MFPTVRFAVTHQMASCSLETARKHYPFMKPDIRLATGVGPPDAFAQGLAYPEVRLAHSPGAQGDNVLVGQRGVAQLEKKPALLVSYVYLDLFLKHRHRYAYRDWVMDSGAFSAHNSGTKIELQGYIDKCKELLASDPTLSEVYSLDVIGDWKASLKNTEEMWRQGVPAIPCFHVDEPWDLLIGMARDYFKIALGGVAYAKIRKKEWWAGQCFNRIWHEIGPTRVHGFAYGGEKALLTFPFHSVDATNWELGPCKFGRWKSYGDQAVSVRGSKQNLRIEVEFYLKLEQRARKRWAKEMVRIEEAAKARNPKYTAASEQRLDVRLSVASQSRVTGEKSPFV